MSPHIRVEHYSYRHASRKRQALSELTFTIERGEKVLLLGASGAGKSTLLHAIAGLLGADEGEHSGTMEVQGITGMVLQDPDAQVIAATVGDDVAFGCENMRMPREEIWQRVPQALAQVGLDLPLDHPTHKLSGGQKQRLALAGVLAMGADIVLLDEPTANLDPEGVNEVVEAARRLDTTLIVVEHRVSTWIEHIDRIIVLGNQGILADGEPHAVLQAQGAQLAAEGVWIPGEEPALPKARASDPEAPAAIEATDLGFGWEQTLGRIEHFLLPKGSSTVITGPNGSGKTTLLLTIAGLLEPTASSVEVHPSIAGSLSPNPLRWKSPELAKRIGYVFQDPEHQFVAKTVREEVLVGLGRLDEQEQQAARERADAVLERLGLSHLAEANPFTLSGGQKRRLSVATVLIHSPEIVLLDEPTFGQDRRTFIALVELLRELTDQGVTVCSITHDALYRQALGDQEINL